VSVATTLCLQSGTNCGETEIWSGTPGRCLIRLVHGERVPQLRHQPFRKYISAQLLGPGRCG